MTEYHGLKSTLYKNTNGKQMNMDIETSITRFNYYCGFGADGTLLHTAVSSNFVGYVELLLKDEFDPNIKNRAIMQDTPVSLAKQNNHMAILPLLEDAINSKNGESKESEEKETEIEAMDMKSLSLRYDVTYIFVFTLPFSFCLFCFFPII